MTQRVAQKKRLDIIILKKNFEQNWILLKK